MNLEMKAAFAAEIEALAEMRVQFIVDLHPELAANADVLASAMRTYFLEHLRQERYIGYLGRLGGSLVCSAGLLLYDLPPLRTSAPRRVGHVLNFYTVPEMRGRGVGSRMLEFMIGDARQRGLNRLVLNATKQGEALYRGAGFNAQDEVHLIKEL